MNDKTQRDDGAMADGGTESLNVAASDPDTVDRLPDAKEEFMLEIVRRARLLQSIQDGCTDTDEILEAVDLSKSTVHRAINSLEEYDIVEKSNGECELTTLGEVITEETRTFGTRALTTVSLKQFLNAIELNGDRFPIEHFTDARITRRKARQPHNTIHRIIELFENSDSLRMFSTVISPVYVDVGYREMMDGMKITAIFDQEVIDIMLSEYPEKAYETITTGNFEVFAHDGLPFEMFIFDDKIGLAAHNENGNAEVLVECDDPAAIEWAETLYAEHRSRADPLLIDDL